VRSTLTACAALLLGTSAIAASPTPAEASDPVAFFAAQPYNGASSLDLSTHALAETSIGEDVGEFAFSPDGRTAYVTFGGGIKAINVETKAVEGATIGFEGWVKYIAVTPDGKKAFVAEEKSQRVFDVELGGRHEDKQIEVDEVGGIEGLAVSAVGPTVFAMDSRLHGVIPIDASTDAASAPIVVSSGEEKIAAMAMSPDGRTLYIARSDAIVPVDVATRTAETPIVAAHWTTAALAVSPDGKTLYAAGWSNEVFSQTPGVLPVDLASGSTGAPIAIGTESRQDPNSIAVTPDGRTAYLTGYESASVTPVDLVARTAEPAIAVAKYPSAIAIEPMPAAPAPAPVPAPHASQPRPTTGAAAVHCVVPRLARIPLVSIRKRLRRNHCRLAWVRYRHSHRRRGFLVSQSVRAGRRIAGEAKVGVILSRGPRRRRA
jgi:DNA-binding beta-propeller fold protein YncE